MINGGTPETVTLVDVHSMRRKGQEKLTNSQPSPSMLSKRGREREEERGRDKDGGREMGKERERKSEREGTQLIPVATAWGQ